MIIFKNFKFHILSVKGYFYRFKFYFFTPIEKTAIKNYYCPMGFSDNVKNILADFINPDTYSALINFTETPENNGADVDSIAEMFGFSGKFSAENSEFQNSLIESFKHNLELLIQKTWVEKSDVTIKQQILFQLNEFLNGEPDWCESYKTFREIIDAAVNLMFGQQTKAGDFCEYSLRIDPGFGLFWCYIQNLPRQSDWPSEKCRNAVLLGMYFLANY